MKRRPSPPTNGPDAVAPAVTEADLSILRELAAGAGARLDEAAPDWRRLAGAAALAAMRRSLDELADALAPAMGSGATPARRADRARSILAEILVALRLLESGCSIEREVETPRGRHVDFRARRDGETLDVHVKRAPPLPPARLGATRTPGAIPRSWRALESIRRGIVVAIGLERNVRGSALLAALAEATDFLEQCSLGDACVIRGTDGEPLARLRALAPAPTARIEIVPDAWQSPEERIRRMQSNFRKAFAQFMPGSENLVVVCGAADDQETFATALLGSHVERWDRRPRVGAAVAYGRAGDGFWAGDLRSESRLAVFWPLAPHAGPRLFIRTGGVPRNAALELARNVFAPAS